jgi:hypothetical protein
MEETRETIPAAARQRHAEAMQKARTLTGRERLRLIKQAGAAYLQALGEAAPGLGRQAEER